MQNALPHAAMRSAIWIALIVGASLGFSLAFACATPFVALAALAGTQMSARDALLAVLLAWLGNQAIGFMVLHYPMAPTSFAWGGAIGLAALLACGVACAAKVLPLQTSARTAIAFIFGFIGYEALLYATAVVLGSGGGAFTLPIVARIFAINAVALVGLLVLHRGATGLGLLAPREQARLAAV